MEDFTTAICVLLRTAVFRWRWRWGPATFDVVNRDRAIIEMQYSMDQAMADEVWGF